MNWKSPPTVLVLWATVRTYPGSSLMYIFSLGINALAVVVSWKHMITMPGAWISCVRISYYLFQALRNTGQENRNLSSLVLSLELYSSASVQNTTRCLQSVISALLKCSQKCWNYPDFHMQLHKVLLGYWRVFIGPLETPQKQQTRISWLGFSIQSTVKFPWVRDG